MPLDDDFVVGYDRPPLDDDRGSCRGESCSSIVGGGGRSPLDVLGRDGSDRGGSDRRGSSISGGRSGGRPPLDVFGRRVRGGKSSGTDFRRCQFGGSRQPSLCP